MTQINPAPQNVGQSHPIQASKGQKKDLPKSTSDNHVPKTVTTDGKVNETPVSVKSVDKELLIPLDRQDNEDLKSFLSIVTDKDLRTMDTSGLPEEQAEMIELLRDKTVKQLVHKLRTMKLSCFSSQEDYETALPIATKLKERIDSEYPRARDVIVRFLELHKSTDKPSDPVAVTVAVFQWGVAVQAAVAVQGVVFVAGGSVNDFEDADLGYSMI